MARLNMCIICYRKQDKQSSFNEAARTYAQRLTYSRRMCDVPVCELQPQELCMTFEMCSLCYECGTRVYKEEVQEFERYARTEISRALMVLRDISVAEEVANIEIRRRHAEELIRQEAERMWRYRELILQEAEREQQKAAEIVAAVKVARTWRDEEQKRQKAAEEEDKKKFNAASSAAFAESEDDLNAIKPCFSKTCNGRFKMGVLKGLCGLCR